MDIFLLFFLAHLAGDFVLQTNKIAALKMSSTKGLIIHTLLVSAVAMALLSILGANGIAIGFISGVFHLVIDYIKTKLQKKIYIKGLIYFLLDQALHLIVIALLVKAFLSIYANYSLQSSWFITWIGIAADDFIAGVRLIILFILITYVSTIFVKMILRDLYPDVRKTAFFFKWERIIDAFIGALTFVCIYFLDIYALIPFILLYFLYSRIQMKLFEYHKNIAPVKYVTILLTNTLLYLVFF